MPKKYEIKEKVSDNVLEQLLHNRGIKTEEEKNKFLNPDFEKHLYDPFLLPDMEKSTLKILETIEKNEKIGIWSDYDADGIPGGALLHDFFKLIGFENFINYIPNRHTEGYGLNSEGVEELGNNGVKLLITIDCGIRDHKEILHANNLGMEVIVTDHHEAGDDLPEAFAIINPKLNSSQYPEKILCGTGVVWKLIESVLKILKDDKNSLTIRLRSRQIQIPKIGFEKWLLDLVGIATLSDMVPLVGENRVLASFGLKVLRKTKRVGLQNFFDNLRINKFNLNEDDIYFSITPKINAASRMGHPMDAFKLLVAKDEVEAKIFAEHLDNINNERKLLVAGIVREAKKRIKEKIENEGDKKLIVLGNPNWRPAILGLAASSIVEEYNRPVFLWGRENGEFIKGSCRSDGIVDLVSLMEKAKDFFLEFGGHKMSGGFSVHPEKIHHLEDALIEVSNHELLGHKKIYVDAELQIKNISEDFVSKILKFAPFGVGNEKPLFIFKNVIPEKINRFGKNKEHLSIIFRDGLKSIKAISFFTSPDKFGDLLKEGIKTNLVANIEKSFWNGSSEIRLRIVDFF